MVPRRGRVSYVDRLVARETLFSHLFTIRPRRARPKTRIDYSYPIKKGPTLAKSSTSAVHKVRILLTAIRNQQWH